MFEKDEKEGVRAKTPPSGRYILETIGARDSFSVVMLARGIGHDQSHPLTVLTCLMSDLYLNETDPIKKAAYKDVLGAIDNLTNLSSELLSIGLPESRRRKLISLPDVVNQMLHLCLRGTRVVAKSDMADIILLPDMDLLDMCRLLQNLVLNARHAMGREGEIGVRAKNFQENGQTFLRLEVWDNGPGLPDDWLEVIKGLTPSRQGETHGLGIKICLKIVERYGGRLEVDSSRGKGTTFIIEMPILRPTP